MIQLVQIINFIGDILILTIIVQSIMSWITRNPYNPFYRILSRITDPILIPIRRFMPDLGGLDISPIIAIILIEIIRKVLLSVLLFDSAY